MGYLLIRAHTDAHLQPGTQEYDQACRYRGAIVEARDDAHPFSAYERTVFVRLWAPGVPLDRLYRFVRPQHDPITPRRFLRKWRHLLRWSDLPAAARNRLQNAREIVVSTTFHDPAIHPSADYTWAQVRSFLRDLQAGTDEDGEL